MEELQKKDAELISTDLASLLIIGGDENGESLK